MNCRTDRPHKTTDGRTQAGSNHPAAVQHYNREEQAAMKNLLSFRDYCKKTHPVVILYDDENNGEYIPNYPQRGTTCNPLKLCLAFESIAVDFNPNTVTLKGDSGIMRFCFVTGVNIETAGSPLGDTVTLYCSLGERKASYTLIMR